MTQFPRSCHGVLHAQRISICSLLRATSDTVSQGTSMRWTDLFKHWSFCSGASSPIPDQPAKGLIDHVHSITHRVLFVGKGSDETDPLPSSGLGTSRVTSSMWQLVLSSLPWQQWCHAEAHDFWKGFSNIYTYCLCIYIYTIYILCRKMRVRVRVRLKKQGNEHMRDYLSVSGICLWAFLVQAFNQCKEEAQKHRSKLFILLPELQNCERCPSFCSLCASSFSDPVV